MTELQAAIPAPIMTERPLVPSMPSAHVTTLRYGYMPWFRFTLFTKFSITSLALLAVMGVLLGMGLTRHFEEQAIEQQKMASASLVPPVVGRHLDDALLTNGAKGEVYEDIQRSLSFLGGSNLVAAKVWNRDGVVIYSDQEYLVGQEQPLTSQLRSNFEGSITAEIEPISAAENAEERGYGDLMKVYTPLQMPGTSRIGAVFEGSYDVTDLRQRISYTNGFLWVSIAGGFLFLYLSLFTIVRNASSRLERQSAENAQLYHEAQHQLAERHVAEERIKLQVEHLQALRDIDIAIASNPDLALTLNVLLTQVRAQLKVDAADVLLLDERAKELEYAAGSGFRAEAVAGTRLWLGQGYAGKAALQRRTIGVENMTNTGDLARAELLAGEEFEAYYAVPLVAKDKVLGVLEVFQRGPLHATPDWLKFLEALAGQAAIAVDSAALFDSLQRSNAELARAYDKTLEGWSRALDLRDKETEGHSRRVTEMTVRLAREMGVGEDELVHIQRGALLHDIGKVGIPDSILLKPGPLTEEEWTIMRMHPVHAYELLRPITFLEPALDIPYCHHEKWDGTGYPRGLRGDEIPLAARIFAVADVYDALRSNRPYRSARPRQMVVAYIIEQAGKHFDPNVVEAFLRVELSSPAQLVWQSTPAGPAVITPTQPGSYAGVMLAPAEESASAVVAARPA
ncbi:MAG: HD domain-containing protein [Chloroflexota bacterium]|nr:HD domain-containing protein [Chloroflexota bacterium]